MKSDPQIEQLDRLVGQLSNNVSPTVQTDLDSWTGQDPPIRGSVRPSNYSKAVGLDSEVSWTDLERAIAAEFLADEIAELSDPAMKAIEVPF